MVPTKEQIIKLLNQNNKAVARALVVLNERQTSAEQRSEATINHNGIGFTPADARMGTSMAGFYQRTGYLSVKQLAYWRKPNKNGVPRICKYAGQLVEIAKEKAAKQTQQAAIEDVGNLLEELTALQERFDDYQDSDDFETLNKIQARINEITAEINKMAEAV